MSSYTNIFGGSTVSPSNVSYLAVTFAVNFTLFWPIPGVNVPPNTAQATASRIMDINPTVDGLSISMPNATSVSTGTDILFNNISAHGVDIKDADGNVLTTINAGEVKYLYLISNSTVAGIYRVFPFAQGSGAVTNVNAMSSDPNNLQITGVPITGVGTIVFTLLNDLAALVGFGAGVGYASRTAANTWALHTFQQTANQITITNPNGVGGDATFALAANITGISSLSTTNLSIGLTTANTIAATNVNGSINLNANGTGEVVSNSNLSVASGNLLKLFRTNNAFYTAFKGGDIAANTTLILPTTQPAIGQVMSNTSAASPYQMAWTNVVGFVGASTDNAIARFDGTGGAIQNSGILIDDNNNMTSVHSITVQATVPVPGSITTEIDASGNSQIHNTIADTNMFLDTLGIGIVRVSNLSFPTTAINTASIESSALTSTGTSALTYAGIANKNLLANGAFQIWQRGLIVNSTSFIYVNNNGTYTADRWILLSDGNNVVTHSQVAAVTNSNTYASNVALRQTVVTPNLKFGVAQILESRDSAQILNEVLSLSLVATGVNINNIRIALLVWNDASDPTAAIVAPGNWGGAGVNPTLAANWSYVSVSGNFAITGNFVRYKRNAINTTGFPGRIYAVFAWVDDVTAPIGATLDFTCEKLEQGPSATTFVPVENAVELLLARRWFRKDLPYSVAIGTTAIQNANARILGIGGTVANNIDYRYVSSDEDMRITPTVTTYPITTTTNLNRCSDNTGTDLAADSAVVTSIDSKCFNVRNQSGGAILTTNYYQCHWIQEAGF